MAVDVEDTIRPDWMHPEAKPLVIGYLRTLPLRPSARRQILARWALMVGAQVDPEELVYVQVLQR